MKKQLIYQLFFLIVIITFSEELSAQCVIDEGFENSTCDPSKDESFEKPFFLGCFDDWISTHGSADTFFPVDHYEGNVSAHIHTSHINNIAACPDEDIHTSDGIALNYDFQEGVKYELTYAIKVRNTTIPLTLPTNLELNWVLLTEGLPNSSPGATAQCGPWLDLPLLPSTPEESRFLESPEIIIDDWVLETNVFTPERNYSQLWFRAKNTNPTGSGNQAFSIFLDAIKVKILDDCDTNDTPDFSMEITCDNGNKCVKATALEQSETNHWWGLYEVIDYFDPNNTDDDNTADGDDDASNGITWVKKITFQKSATFCDLDPGKKYYIKHGIWKEDCYGWTEVRMPVPVFEGKSVFDIETVNGEETHTFCLGEDVYLDGTASTNESQYSIHIWRRPLGSTNPDDYNWYGSPGWETGQVTSINLSAIYANLESPLYFEPNYEYEVQLAIANPKECVQWTASKQSFIVECCDDLLADASFSLNENSGGTMNVTNFQDYSEYGVEHDWVVYSSVDFDLGGLDPKIKEGTGLTFDFQIADPNLVYIIVHTITTPCGVYCYAIFKRGIIENGMEFPCSLKIKGGGDGTQKRMLNNHEAVGSYGTLKVSISPNPSRGVMHIDIETKNDEALELHVYRLDGTLIKSITDLNTVKGALKFKLEDQKLLTRGIYFIKIISNHSATTKKIIVN